MRDLQNLSPSPPVGLEFFRSMERAPAALFASKPRCGYHSLHMWYDLFDLIMFDFDGVLVDSEAAHYRAYCSMCASFGVAMAWDFKTYCSYAHYGSDHLREALYSNYPALQQWDWSTLYLKKTEMLKDEYERGTVSLLPGVEPLLQRLAQEGKERCVVTHSSLEVVSLLRRCHPILNSIPYWVTREDYTAPKPAADCYLLALERYLIPGGRAIGFEDTLRGLQALMGSGATAVIIPYGDYPELPFYLSKGAYRLPSLEALLLLREVSHGHEKQSS